MDLDEQQSEQQYEPPMIEAVLSPEELKREILYAADVISCEPDSKLC